MILGLLLMGCSDRETESLVDSETEVKCVEFEVPPFEPDVTDSRVNININQQGVFFTWEATDTVGIYPLLGQQVPFGMNSSGSNNVANFDGGPWGLKRSSRYSAYYPYSVQQYRRSMNNVEVSYLNQSMASNASTETVGNYDFLASPFQTVTAMGYVHFKMSHLGSLVQLKLRFPRAVVVKDVVLKSEKQEFVHKASFNLADSLPTLVPTLLSDSLAIGMEDVDVEAGQDLTLYFMMNQSADHSDHWVAHVVTEGAVSFKGAVGIHTIVAGRSYSFSAVVTEEHISLPIFDGESGDPSQPIL